MGIEKILMGAAAILPALILLIYVYKKDRVEKEPIGLLLILLAAGVIICFPVGYIEGLLEGLLDIIFENSYYVEGDTAYFTSDFAYYLYNILDNLFCVALVEEGAKWIALFLLTRKNKNFNSFFDGIIYSVCVSLGFAGYENIGYVFTFGGDVALTRAVTAVPGHMFFAVVMGIFYTQWNVLKKTQAIESDLKRQGLLRGVILTDEPAAMLLKSIVIPVLMHGFYDFCCSISTGLFVVLFYVFLGGMYFFCFRKIRKISSQDTNADSLAFLFVLTRHPDFRQIYEAYVQSQNASQTASQTSAPGNSQNSGQRYF